MRKDKNCIEILHEKDAFVEYNSISDELCIYAYDKLEEKVIIDYFQVD